MAEISASTLDARMERLFDSNPELASAVRAVVQRYPDTLPTFERVIEYFQHESDAERPTKRLKAEPSVIDLSSEAASENKADVKRNLPTDSILTLHELSFVTPVRKKLNVHINKDSLTAHQGQSETAEVQVKYQDISLIALLPVPEKATKLYNFCLFRKHSEEAVVFTVPDASPKNVSGPATQDKHASSYTSLIKDTLKEIDPRLKVVEPSTKDFTSAIPQAHRKSEPAVHVVAHRGSKEGYLFFLSAGLVYGFKRPLLFIPLDNVVSVTFNDVLQRTFNLTFAVRQEIVKDEEAEPEEIEFSMVDAAEHDAVNHYITKYKLNNASLSESRRAKVSKNGLSGASNESEISKAADAIAATVTGVEQGSSDEEEDGDFKDDESHSGSTIASDDSEAEENSDQASDIDIEQESDPENDDDS